MNDVILNEIRSIQEWIINDQYEYGEWGKHEAKNRVGEHRTMDTSRIKPHFFSSLYAYYSLISTNAPAGLWSERYLKWVNDLRDNNGFWTSASGSVMPFGMDRGWSDVINIRHSAKGLDLLMLLHEFVADDTKVFEHIVNSQHDNGSYSQLIDGNEDIWSTVYVMNLLIRAMQPINIGLTRPRNVKTKEWLIRLNNNLSRACDWLILKRTFDGLWSIENRDPHWVSEAVILEIGAYLSLKHPMVCNSVVKKLLENRDSRQPVILFGALLVFETLDPDVQKDVLKRVDELCSQEKSNINDMLEATSICKLLYIKNNIGALALLKEITSGHESCLRRNEFWDINRYTLLRIEKYKKGGIIVRDYYPIDEMEGWKTVDYLLDVFKRQIEDERVWELLWDNKDKPKDEKAVQICFQSIIKPIAFSEGSLIIREPETGRGPVDFLFSNGVKTRVLIEFKLSTNNALKRNFCQQMDEYMNGFGVSVTYLVIVGFEAMDLQFQETIIKHINEYMNNNRGRTIRPIFINACRKEGASKHN